MTMVLTRQELIAILLHEVRILQHLATKIDPAMLDYRPTPKQRSTLELLQYLSMMGPTLIAAANAGRFDPTAWTLAEQESKARDFAQTMAAIGAQGETYQALVSRMSDADLRQEVEIFGRKSTRGQFLVTVVAAGFAAYRTQLFLYLKSCGRHELSTTNLWAGADPVHASV